MKILLVDDSHAVRLKLRNCFLELGHEIVGEASNGSEALSLFSRVKPDLVTLDIVMPGMDGISVLKSIREKDSQVWVLMVSSAAKPSNMEQAEKAGASGFLVKPFFKEQLFEILKDLAEEIDLRKAA